MIPDLKCKVVHTEEYKGITIQIIHNPAYVYYGRAELQYFVELWRPGDGIKSGKMVPCRGEYRGTIAACLNVARKAVDNDEYN